MKVLISYKLAIRVSFKYQHWASTIRPNQSPDLRMQTCCYIYFLGIQCKRQNIPDHAFYSYSVLNRSLSYICNISFLEVHLESVATRSDWYAYVVFNRPFPIFCFHIVNLTDPLFHLMKHSQNMKVCSV